MDKRDGGGAHNWGNAVDTTDFDQENQDIAGEERSGDENNLDATETNQNETNAADANDETKEEGQVDEGPKQMTLDEWKREQEEKRLQPKFNLRKPGEGEDKSKWKDAVPLKKKVDDQEEEVEYEEIEVVSLND